MEYLSSRIDSLTVTNNVNEMEDDIFPEDNEKTAIPLHLAKEKFQNLLCSIRKTDVDDFSVYIYELLAGSKFDSSQDFSYTSEQSREEALSDKLKEISNDIRQLLPMEAVFPSEKIVPPTKGQHADCLNDLTTHVDEFLYDDVEMEQLVEDGKLKKYYCKDCGSREVGILILLSHSMSRDALYYIFKTQIVTNGKKTILDIGSRLGAVLYGAYVYTDAERIIGVEMNKDFCDLQNTMIEKHHMTDRIEIYNNRIEDVEELVKAADVIIINNSFEFYVSEEEQIYIWKFLRNCIKSGTILVIRPHLETIFTNINVGFSLEKWVRSYKISENDLNNSYTGVEIDIDEAEFCDLGFYKVL